MPDLDEVLKDLQEARTKTAPPSASGPGGAPLPGAQIDPKNIFADLKAAAGKDKPKTDYGTALWEGLKQGGTETLQGVEQLASKMPTMLPGAQAGQQRMQQDIDQRIQQSAQGYQQNPAVQAHPMVAGAGRIGGNIAATAPMMAMPGGLAGAAGRTGAGLMTRGAAAGAAGAATQPATSPDFWGEKMRQVAGGGAVGAALPGLGGMMSPRLPNPETITSGISRAFRPLSNFLMGAEERTKEGFDRTIARQVLEPIGGNIEGRASGFKLNDQVKDQIDSAYDRVLPKIQLSENGFRAPNKRRDDSLAALLPEEAKVYTSVVDRALPNDLTLKGYMTGPEFREARTRIAEQGYKFLGTNKHDIGEALVQTANHMTDAVVKENGVYGADLQKAGEAYKLWMRMAAAASKPGAGGKFSPKDMLEAIGRQESDSKIATGEGVLQGYSQAAHVAMGGDKRMSMADLMHIFARHGLPADMYRSVAGPAGRLGKAATPYAAPGMGAVEGRREDTLSIAPDRDPHVSTVGP